MKQDLNNKTILLIAPKFFGYEYDIKRELENRGAVVYYIQENIDSASFKEKVINQLPVERQNKIRQRYFISKFREVIPHDIKIDYVFGIRMDLLDRDALDYLKTTYPQARYMCYFWDSCKNMRNAELVASYFDKVLTFDRQDAVCHEGWIFRPLFFINDYEKCRMRKDAPLDILFVGTLQPQRAELYLWLKNFCNQHGLSIYTYFYCKTFVYWFNKIKQKAYRRIPNHIVHNKGMNKKTLIQKFCDAKVVFDWSSPTQSGLTMRTIECIGAKKKMITTNKEIMKYDFYREDNIFVYDEDKQSEMVDFIKNCKYLELDSPLYEYYSIQGWINTIFDI